MIRTEAARIVARGLDLENGPKKEARVTINTNKNDVFGGEASEFPYLPPKMYYYLVDLRSEPICLDTLRSGDPNIRATKSMYTIQYIPQGSVARRGDYCYLIGQDLLRMRILVSGYNHWLALCSRIPELNWLNRNSTLTPEYFGIAKKHPGMIFRFTVDFPRYSKLITEKAEKQGIDIDNKPFVCYVYPHDVYEKYKDKKFANRRTKQDYLDEIEAARAEAEGNDED